MSSPPYAIDLHNGESLGCGPGFAAGLPDWYRRRPTLDELQGEVDALLAEDSQRTREAALVSVLSHHPEVFDRRAPAAQTYRLPLGAQQVSVDGLAVCVDPDEPEPEPEGEVLELLGKLHQALLRQGGAPAGTPRAQLLLTANTVGDTG